MPMMTASAQSFEDILLCSPQFMDPTQGPILWWCKCPEDIQAWPLNSVCLAGLASWKDVQRCKGWVCRYQAVFVASPDREFVETVKAHVPWLPILSPRKGAFGSYQTVAEYAAACGTSQLEHDLIIGAVTEPISGLLNIADVKRRDTQNVPRTLSGFNRLDRALGGFREGEMTVWTGPRGNGKSTIMNQVLIEAIDQGRKVCVYSGELTAARFKAWVMAQAAGPENMEELQDPQTGETIYLVPDVTAKTIDGWWDRKFYIYDLSISAAHGEDSILDEFEYARRCLRCDVFAVDSVMTVKLNDSRDYYRAQSEFVRRLAEFCKATNTHLHLIAHPRKSEKGKKVEDNDDVSGSGDITNFADNVLAVSRLPEPGPDGRDAELKVMKSREDGIMGKIGLCFDRASRRFYPTGGNPNKKYGWEKKQEFVECDYPDPF